MNFIIIFFPILIFVGPLYIYRSQSIYIYRRNNRSTGSPKYLTNNLRLNVTLDNNVTVDKIFDFSFVQENYCTLSSSNSI